MNQREIQKIIRDCGRVRISCSKEEKFTAEYLAAKCNEMGISAKAESFELPVTTFKKAVLTANGREIPCTGYELCGSGVIEAPLVYIPAVDQVTLKQVKGKIVLLDTGLRHFTYNDMLDAGAVGFITYDGDVKWKDNDIDVKELRKVVTEDRKVLCANVNAKDAARLVKMGEPMVKIEIEQTEGTGLSWNAVAEIPGECDQWIVLSAHLDSRPNAAGVWDNLTGCIALLDALEAVKKSGPHHFGVKALFCGSEERGLLGTRAFVESRKEELEKYVLNINVDMIGSTFGQLMCMVTGPESGVNFMKSLALEKAVSLNVMQKVMSSDSSVFADNGIPALAFGNMAPRNQNSIHCRYDDGSTVYIPRIREHSAFITALTLRTADAAFCPIERTIPDKIKDELDKYMSRKR